MGTTPTGRVLPAEHGGWNQALDAVMYQASFSGNVRKCFELRQNSEINRSTDNILTQDGGIL
jgi:hypothetical protein